MKKIIENIKKLKLPSKILICVWMFCMFVVTFACAVGTEGNLTSDDTTILLLGYIIFSNFFLVPAIAFDKFIKAQEKRGVKNQIHRKRRIFYRVGSIQNFENVGYQKSSVTCF